MMSSQKKKPDCGSRGCVCWFIGGKAAGAAGGTVGSVFRQARERLNSSQEQRVDQKINDEQFGETDTGVTTPEPKVDLDAQLNAIHDPNSTKQAVWIAGEQGRERFPEDGRYEEDGKVFYTRYIPGRGTIVTKDEQLADEVVKSGADEQSLATALGYTAVKPEDAAFVVEALDAQGNVVSAELATAETLEAVQENARQLSPIYQFRVSSVDQSLERRKQKLDAEGVRPMEIPRKSLKRFRCRKVKRLLSQAMHHVSRAIYFPAKKPREIHLLKSLVTILA